jgi:hypothetical protein
MPIGNVIQRGFAFYVYDEKGRLLFSRPVASGPNNGIQGYTCETVNVRIGNMIYSYNEKGYQISMRPV